MASHCTPATSARPDLISIADQLAERGYLTVIPDIWEGDNVPLDWSPVSTFPLGSWMPKHGPNKVVPISQGVVRAMRENHGVKKLGSVGYCLGAKYVCRFMAEGKGIDAGFFAHPTAVTAEEIKAVAGPLSIAVAGECVPHLCRGDILSSRRDG